MLNATTPRSVVHTPIECPIKRTMTLAFGRESHKYFPVWYVVNGMEYLRTHWTLYLSVVYESLWATKYVACKFLPHDSIVLLTNWFIVYDRYNLHLTADKLTCIVSAIQPTQLSVRQNLKYYRIPNVGYGEWWLLHWLLVDALKKGKEMLTWCS